MPKIPAGKGQLAVYLHVGVLQEVRVKAALRNMTQSDLVEAAIIQYLGLSVEAPKPGGK